MPQLPGIRELWRRCVEPRAAFARRASEAPSLGGSCRNLLLLRAPVEAAGQLLGFLLLASAWAELRACRGPAALVAEALGPEQAEGLRELLAALPTLPPVARVLPWIPPLALLAVLGLWLHHTVWDHMMLMLLGGLRERRDWRSSFIAEAEALQAGTLGALAGLLGRVPVLGWLLALPLGLLGLWFWALRGFALAAWHGCPAWKGVLATALHLVLLPVLALLLLGAAVLLALALAGMAC